MQRIDFKVESTFNDKDYYQIGPVEFSYTPHGAILKDIHFVLDGKEIAVESTTYSNISLPFIIPAQKHGSHLLEVYMTADVNGSVVTSNTVKKDILWYDGVT